MSDYVIVYPHVSAFLESRSLDLGENELGWIQTGTTAMRTMSTPHVNWTRTFFTYGILCGNPLPFNTRQSNYTVRGVL